MRVAACLAVLLATYACSGSASGPAALDPKNDTCSYCRMTVSNPRLAAQLVAPGEEPRFFDDLGCLANYLREHRGMDPAGVYVADHRTGEWIDAARAVYSRLPHATTPMASGLIAHATTASRDDDRGAVGSSPVPAAEVLGGSER